MIETVKNVISILYNDAKVVFICEKTKYFALFLGRKTKEHIFGAADKPCGWGCYNQNQENRFVSAPRAWALCHLRVEGLCEALPLTALNPQMADSPTSNLGADTKKTFKTGWRGKIHKKVDFLKLDIALTPRQPVFKVFLAVMQARGTRAVSSSVPACRSLLRSMSAPEKKQRAQPLHHGKRFYLFL